MAPEILDISEASHKVRFFETKHFMIIHCNCLRYTSEIHPLEEEQTSLQRRITTQRR
jgi:hypothetical protein